MLNSRTANAPSRTAATRAVTLIEIFAIHKVPEEEAAIRVSAVPLGKKVVVLINVRSRAVLQSAECLTSILLINRSRTKTLLQINQ